MRLVCFDIEVFTFEVQSWRYIRVQLGRWHFRTWRSFFMLLPPGYTSGLVWAVQFEQADPDSPATGQLGAFVDEEQARRCLEALEQEGWSGLYLSMVPVHARLEDWQWDR
ncbi:hypothetical protein ASG04_12670 [Curtobacterium sp. Leaf183]|nr:hypothetical protein ASG04_12670 [Curtobacterium sp. Leaf183]